MVSIVANTDYTTLGAGAYLREPAVGLNPALWTVDHTSSTTCRYLPGFYTGTKLYCLVTEAHGCEQLVQSCYLDRTHDLSIMNPTP